MRRRPRETPQRTDSRVFPINEWENDDFKYVEQENEKDITRYAASKIPEIKHRKTRTSRYSPSAQSQNGESIPETNSEQDPFSHSAHDTRHLQYQRNKKVEDMPTPTRKSLLDKPVPSVTPEDMALPATHAPIERTVVDANSVVIEEDEQESSVDDHIYEEAQVPELELSDFEEDFLVAREEKIVEVSLPDTQKDSGAGNKRSVAKVGRMAPRTFSDSTIDDFYDAERVAGQTIQIDWAFVKRQSRKLIENKIALAAVLLLVLALGALVVLTAGSSDDPAVIDTSKLVTPTEGNDSLITYDANGNPVYESTDSNGFNG